MVDKLIDALAEIQETIERATHDHKIYEQRLAAYREKLERWRLELKRLGLIKRR